MGETGFDEPYQHFWGMTAILSALLLGNMLVSRTNAQQPATVPDVLTAHEFRLVDKSSRLRATMSLGPNGDPQIQMFNPKSKKQIELKLEQTEFYNQPIFAFFDEENGRVQLRLPQVLWRDTVEPQFELFRAERKVANFGININGAPDLYLSDGGGDFMTLKPDTLFFQTPNRQYSGKNFGAILPLSERGICLVPIKSNSAFGLSWINATLKSSFTLGESEKLTGVLNGDTLTVIADTLNQMQIKTCNDRPWYPSTVSQLLKKVE